MPQQLVLKNFCNRVKTTGHIGRFGVARHQVPLYQAHTPTNCLHQ